MVESNIVAYFPLIIILVWLLPFLAILISGKTKGSEKVAWLLAVVFVSWFAWIFYLLLAPLKKRKVNYEQALNPVIGLQEGDRSPINVYTSQKSTINASSGKGKMEVTTKPNLQDWLKSNPGKTINDYFIKFGK